MLITIATAERFRDWVWSYRFWNHSKSFFNQNFRKRYKTQKQSPGGVLCRCSQKLCKIHRKTSVLESLFLNLCSLVKKKVWHLSVLCEFCKICRNMFCTEDHRNMGKTLRLTKSYIKNTLKMRLKNFSGRPRLFVRKDRTFWLVYAEMDAHKLFFRKSETKSHKILCKKYAIPLKAREISL